MSRTDYRRTVVFIDPEIVKQTKIAALQVGMTLSEFVEKVLKEMLGLKGGVEAKS